MHRDTVARGPVPRDRRLHRDTVARGPSDAIRASERVSPAISGSILLFLQFHVSSMAFNVALRLLLNRLLKSRLKVYVGLIRQAD